jgi:hypothetical protein
MMQTLLVERVSALSSLAIGMAYQNLKERKL